MTPLDVAAQRTLDIVTKRCQVSDNMSPQNSAGACTYAVDTVQEPTCAWKKQMMPMSERRTPRSTSCFTSRFTACASAGFDALRAASYTSLPLQAAETAVCYNCSTFCKVMMS